MVELGLHKRGRTDSCAAGSAKKHGGKGCGVVTHDRCVGGVVDDPVVLELVEDLADFAQRGHERSRRSSGSANCAGPKALLAGPRSTMLRSCRSPGLQDTDPVGPGPLDTGERANDAEVAVARSSQLDAHADDHFGRSWRYRLVEEPGAHCKVVTVHNELDHAGGEVFGERCYPVSYLQDGHDTIEALGCQPIPQTVDHIAQTSPHCVDAMAGLSLRVTQDRGVHPVKMGRILDPIASVEFDEPNGRRIFRHDLIEPDLQPADTRVEVGREPADGEPGNLALVMPTSRDLFGGQYSCGELCRCEQG